MNKYADIRDGKTVFAQTPIVVNGRVCQNPSKSDFAARSWWPFYESHPSPVLGFYEAFDYDEKIEIKKTRKVMKTDLLTEEENLENESRIQAYEEEYRAFEESHAAELSAGDDVEGWPEFPALIEHLPYEADEEYSEYEICRHYKLVEAPVLEHMPRRWTKLKLEVALAQAGWYQEAKVAMESIEFLPGYPMYRAFDAASYIEEFYPDKDTWNQMLDTMAEKLGKTREQIDAFLKTVQTEN